MNSALLRNLTDHEFLKQAHPSTDLEQMLIERLEGAESAEQELERAEHAASIAEDAQAEAETKAEDLASEIESLRRYANRLHAALAEANAENELLDCDDAELLRP